MPEWQGDDVPLMIAVTYDVMDLEVSARFWSELLGMEVAGIEDPFAFLNPAPDRKVSIWLQKVAEGKEIKNRAHLDFAVLDLAAAEQRVVALGGSLGDTGSWRDFHWRTCLDPDGNEFDIMQAQQQ